MNARKLGIVHFSEAAIQRHVVPDTFLATREAIQWYQVHTVSLFDNESQSRYVAICESTAGGRKIHTIESASDEEELCAIVANRTVQTGRIEFITPWSIILDCSFEIMENGLAKSLVILVTAAVSELISAWYSFQSPP